MSNPRHLEKSMRKLIREQRKLSRRQKQSTKLIRENQTICIEDLRVKNMMRNHKLAKHIGSVSWSKFFDLLAYKAVWYGCELVKVPAMYPSSQTCSNCGYKNPLVKNLSIRSWECPKCNAVHDRDTNAAINILNKGLQLQST
jgi:putative transposase